ncbi:MAG: hypothetical protein WHV44_07160 [Anaerolineales bacterium]
MMKFSNTEKILLALAVGLGVFIRLLNLGAIPLSDSEARWALQALDLSRGLRPQIGPTPGYVTLTAALFYLFTASDALARLIPALAGSALVLAPLFFTRIIPPRAAVFLAFGLAIDPGLVALSRTAGSSMMAISFLILAAGLWLSERPRAAGILAGLAVLSGPALWSGLLTLLIAGLIWRGLAAGPGALPRPAGASLRQAGLSALITFLVAGSLLLTAPHGLSAALTAPLAFLQGWFAPTGAPFTRLLIAIPAYHLLPLVFGLAGLVRGWREKDPLTPALGIGLGVAFALAVAAPGRQVTDLAWAVLPLWALAARELARLLDDFSFANGEALGAAGLTLAILVFAWLDLASISAGLDANTITLRLGLFAGALVLLGLSLLLVALGWSVKTARLGGASGVLAALVIFTLAAAWGAGGLRTTRTPEMWRAEPSIDQAALLTQTINQLSEWKRGTPASLPITVLGLDSPALTWALRPYAVRQSNVYDASLSAPLIISYDDPNLTFGQTYRGQDFFWRTTPAWDTASLTDWIDWLTRRKIPTAQDKIILWASADIFPGAATTQP